MDPTADKKTENSEPSENKSVDNSKGNSEKDSVEARDIEISKLKEELNSVKGERDRYKNERDEASETLMNMNAKQNTETKLEFDELFGGIK